MKRKRRIVSVDMIRAANKALIERKVYEPHIKSYIEKLPRLTADDFNRAWGNVNDRSKGKGAI